MTAPGRLVAGGCSRVSRECLRDNGLSFLLNSSQMILAEEALGVNLVDFFGARRARREPPILRDHLNPANRAAVSGRCGQNCSIFSPATSVVWMSAGDNLLQCGLLFLSGGSIDTFVNRVP